MSPISSSLILTEFAVRNSCIAFVWATCSFCRRVRRNARSETLWSSRYSVTFSLEYSPDARGDLRCMEAERPWPMRCRSEPPSPAPSGFVFCVETDDTDEASSSAPTLRKDECVELLFFRGNGGSTLPGSSVRSRLCIFEKLPYRFPTYTSAFPTCLTLMMNSYKLISQTSGHSRFWVSDLRRADDISRFVLPRSSVHQQH